MPLEHSQQKGRQGLGAATAAGQQQAKQPQQQQSQQATGKQVSVGTDTAALLVGVLHFVCTVAVPVKGTCTWLATSSCCLHAT